MIWRVPFRICGYIDVDADDGDEAWERAHERGYGSGLGSLANEPGATVDFEVPECQD